MVGLGQSFIRSFGLGSTRIKIVGKRRNPQMGKAFSPGGLKKKDLAL